MSKKIALMLLGLGCTLAYAYTPNPACLYNCLITKNNCLASATTDAAKRACNLDYQSCVQDCRGV